MGSLGSQYQNFALDALLGDGFSPPSNVWIALYTAIPSALGGGTEVSVGSYSRVEVSNDGTTWPAASSGSKANGIAVIFPTASASWGTIVGFGIHDDPSADSLVTWGILGTPQAIALGDTAQFDIGALVITAS